MPDFGIEGDLAARLAKLVDRVDSLERSRSVSIGHWRLTQDDGGSLIALNTRNGKIVTVAPE